MSFEKIKATDVLRKTVSILLRERELFLLLGAFIASVALIFTWPALEINARFIATYLQTGSISFDLMTQLNQEAKEVGNTYFSILLIIVHLAIMAIWSRASILGTKQAVAGGLQPFLNRFLWVLWRALCGMGWMFLLILFLILLFMVLPINPETLIGFSEDPLNNTSFSFNLFMGVIIVIFSIPLMVLIFLTSISIHGEARDIRLPIHKSFKFMKGNLLRGAGVIIALLFAANILLFFGEVFILKSYFTVPIWVTFIGIFAITFLSMLVTLISYTFGAVYASKLVPELRV